MWRSSVLITMTLLFTMMSFFKAVSASSACEGIQLPDIRHVNGVQLKKNGHGIRSISFFGMDIKVYVAEFYSESPLLSAEAVMECHNRDDKNSPMQMDFTFLRSFGQSRVVSAWTQQLDYSVSHTYEGYKEDRDVFVELFSSGPIENGGTQTVQMVGDTTLVFDQGVYKGSIQGKDFQKSFLSMWFGERAVAEDLKANLLSGATHLEAVPVLETPVLAQ
jgi:hypothetical protein